MACTPPPPTNLGRLKSLDKSLLGGGGSERFIFVGGLYCWVRVTQKLKLNNPLICFSNKIFSFSFLYLSSIAIVIVLSIMYVKEPNKHNNQQFNVKAILQKKDSNLCQIWSDLKNIYKFDNTIIFKLRSIVLFCYLDNFLDKAESGLFFQINIA